MAELELLLGLSAPALGAIAIAVSGACIGERVARIGIATLSLSFAISVVTSYRVVVDGPIEFVPSLAAFEAGSLFYPSFLVDRLSAVMMLLITGVSTVIHLFSRRYMQGESGYVRFYVLLGLMTSVLLCLVTSGHLLMLFVFWQLVSWVLYLLLAYNYVDRRAAAYAFKTFVVHRLGDIAFLGGIVVAYRSYGTLEFRELFSAAASHPPMLITVPGIGTEIGAVTVITLLIFVGAMAKSAQFPLHVWLPDTMDTPTPVSALMHAGIVNAGGFLLNRLAPLYGLSPTTLHLIFLVGALTIVLGASMMLTKSNIKRTLGYSTMAQMGYMIMECGLGAFALAIFHLIAHGLFKATLFLNSGNLIHKIRTEPALPRVQATTKHVEFSRLTWVTGVGMTLVLPFIVLLAAHGLLGIPLLHEQGSVIFMFFAWVTSSQALLSLYRLEAVASWKVASTMVLATLLIGVTYLWAGTAFTQFLYPSPGEAARYFEAAAWAPLLFDLIIILSTVLVIGVWIQLYKNVHGMHSFVTPWIVRRQRRIYVLLVNGLYLDLVYQKLGNGILRMAARLNRVV